MTTPTDKVFIRSFSYIEAISPLLTLALAVLGLIFGLGFVFAAAAGILAFCALALLFAVTAPLWAILGALVYAGLLAICLPFYSLYTAFFQNHKAS
jgi:hypothetical protein